MISSFSDFHTRQRVCNCTAQKCFYVHSLSNTFCGSYFQKRCLLTVLADVAGYGTLSSANLQTNIHSFVKVRNAFVEGCWKLVDSSSAQYSNSAKIIVKDKIKQNTRFSLGVFFPFLQQTTGPLYSGSPTGWPVSRPLYQFCATEYLIPRSTCTSLFEPILHVSQTLSATQVQYVE